MKVEGQRREKFFTPLWLRMWSHTDGQLVEKLFDYLNNHPKIREGQLYWQLKNQLRKKKLGKYSFQSNC